MASKRNPKPNKLKINPRKRAKRRRSRRRMRRRKRRRRKRRKRIRRTVTLMTTKPECGRLWLPSETPLTQ